jgi:fermentation-respiration switch protein FrsA (DUF1100 family)
MMTPLTKDRKPRKWRYWRNLLLFGLLVLVVVVVATYAVVSYQGAQFYLRPERVQTRSKDSLAKFGITYQVVTLTTADKIDLASWYTRSENGALILVAHGYGASRSAEMHALFARHGYGVLSWDARAHGASQGQICTWGVREVLDVEAALDFASEQPEIDHIGAYGQSMGAVTLIEAAAPYPQIEAIVADSAFPSIEEMLVRMVSSPLLHPGIRFFVRWETGLSPGDLRPVDTIEAISPRPIFIFQGQADSVVPPDSAQRLYQAAGEPCQLWTEPGVGHVGMYAAHPELFEQKVIGFFDHYLLEK